MKRPQAIGIMNFAPAFAAAVMLCGALAGCNPYYRTGGDPNAPVRQNTVAEMYIDNNLVIEDLPIPSNFDLDGARSRTSATHGNVRVIDHIYTGSGDQLAAARFFRREMPRKNWTGVSEQFSRDTYKLRFVKGAERCEVNIERASFGRLEIFISVFPENISASP